MRILLGLTLSLSLVAAVPASASGFPEDGVVLNGGDQLEVDMFRRIRLRSFPQLTKQRPIPSFRDIVPRRRKPNYVHCERQRRHLRKKALEGKQWGTIGKGVATEVIYKKGRKHAEKSKRNSRAGRGSKSILKSLFR